MMMMMMMMMIAAKQCSSIYNFLHLLVTSSFTSIIVNLISSYKET